MLVITIDGDELETHIQHKVGEWKPYEKKNRFTQREINPQFSVLINNSLLWPVEKLNGRISWQA